MWLGCAGREQVEMLLNMLLPPCRPLSTVYSKRDSDIGCGCFWWVMICMLVLSVSYGSVLTWPSLRPFTCSQIDEGTRRSMGHDCDQLIKAINPSVAPLGSASVQMHCLCHDPQRSHEILPGLSSQRSQESTFLHNLTLPWPCHRRFAGS